MKTTGRSARISFGMAAFVATVALSTLSGCNALKRSEECRSLSDRVNPVVAAVDSERHKSPEAPATYRTIGMQYDMLASALITVKVSSDGLRQVLADYQKLYRDAARDARAFADALDAKDAARINVARAAAGRTVHRESGLAAKFAALCR
jgi:hypothetical protein